MVKSLKVRSHLLNNRLLYAVMLSVLASSDAFAQINNSNISQIFRNTNFQTCITIGFGVFAFFKWVEYFANFNVGSALRDIILPSLLTYLCFQWNKVLQWVGMM